MSSNKNSWQLNPHSIRFRLTALFVTILGITLIGFSVVLYSVFLRSSEKEFDTALFNHTVDVIQGIDINYFGDVSVNSGILSSGGKIFPFSIGKAFLQIMQPNGKVLAKSRTLDTKQLPLTQEDWTILYRDGISFHTLQGKELPTTGQERNSAYRLLNYMVRDRSEIRYILQIAVPMSFLEQECKGLAAFFLFAIPLTLVLATFGGLYLSGRALAPVSNIIEKAKSLSPTNLSERIPVPLIDDELRQLSLTLNELLNRLQKAFESQDRFIADASHQLKTPLAILRGELDLLKSRNRSPEEITEFIQSASQELDHLSRMVQDLLILARVDAGFSSLMIQRVRIDEIALETVSRLERLAQSKGIKIKFNLIGSSFEVDGDADLLQSMLNNLIENAIKFSHEHGSIEVCVQDSSQKDPDTLVVSVHDHGCGIPAEALAKVFDRFYRDQSSRSITRGVGLGLAIARRIAEAHRGILEVESTEHVGTIFRFLIKRF